MKRERCCFPFATAGLESTDGTRLNAYFSQISCSDSKTPRFFNSWCLTLALSLSCKKNLWPNSHYQRNTLTITGQLTSNFNVRSTYLLLSVVSNPWKKCLGVAVLHTALCCKMSSVVTGKFPPTAHFSQVSIHLRISSLSHSLMVLQN